ncbi:ABC transporter ATP-binding protein [Oceanobacillus chungangensis]|uniref:ABC transporter ATP-binding protein n=1 Tax=Oceanobacillus chungangensis TaxID=1229152 RepID=A0A3D8PIT5_9BACI|nr:ABC transporter ATP-binding protein [Oceanobacillus chungangensis]RDW15964.1 ABC transporter ATP-binding protein [Oceanobacillus chungangensis]
MRNVLSFLKAYKFPAVFAFSLMLIELAIELLLPFFLGKMINDGVLNQDINNITMWGSIMLSMALLSLGIGITNSFYSSHVSFAFGYDLRQKLFEKIQSFSYQNMNQYPTSALVTRFTSDVRQIQNTVFMSLRIMAKAPLTVIGGVIMAFIVNARLALIFLVTVPLLILFLLWIMKYASKMFMKVQHNVDNVNRVMQENLVGMRLIKAFMRRDYEESRFDEVNESLANSTKSTFRMIEASMPVLLFVMNISLIIILWFGNTQIGTGNTDVGQVVTIVNYALRVAMAISMFSFIIMIISRTKASAERIDEVFQVEVDLSNQPQPNPNLSITKGKLEYSKVSFSYPDAGKSVLDKISFTLDPGERLAIIGATGSGKTSLFQLIPRLYDPTEGNILVDDQPIASYPLDHLRGSIGYVPQSPLLFTGSIKDNIAWGKTNATMGEIIQAAKDAQIHETIMGLQNQYDTKVGQKGVNLSGGQKQRISIARAFVRKPKILMLDDSTSALDLATEARLLEAIQTYDCTTLIITQKISSAYSADRILLLDGGEIIAIGTYEELLATSLLFQQIVESQYGKEYAHVE